jgi:hypothetical protein
MKPKKSSAQQTATGFGSTSATPTVGSAPPVVGAGTANTATTVGAGLPTQGPGQAAPPPPPTPTPPPDSGLIMAQAGANNAVAIADGWAAYQNTQIGADYGFTADGAIDPNNPYSRAALLQRSYQDSQRGTTNSYASAGQYNSSAYSRMQDRNSENFDVGVDQLKKAEAKERAAVLKGQVDTYSENAAYLSEEQKAAIFRALGMS